MSYDEVIRDVVEVVEALGCAIMVLGAVWALGRFTLDSFRRAGEGSGRYSTLRRDLGRVILLGLEILIIADIIRTVIVDPSVDSVMVLGIIVVIRIVLSFSLEVEMDGVWPWSRWRLAGGVSAGGRSAGDREPDPGADPDDQPPSAPSPTSSN